MDGRPIAHPSSAPSNPVFSLLSPPKPFPPPPLSPPTVSLQRSFNSRARWLREFLSAPTGVQLVVSIPPFFSSFFSFLPFFLPLSVLTNNGVSLPRTRSRCRWLEKPGGGAGPETNGIARNYLLFISSAGVSLVNAPEANARNLKTKKKRGGRE